MPKRPWAHGDSYMKQKDAELQHLLRLRNLPDDGTKTEMASRLILHDHRRSVYRSVSACTDSRRLLISRLALFRSRTSHLKHEPKFISWLLCKTHAGCHVPHGQHKCTQRVLTAPASLRLSRPHQASSVPLNRHTMKGFCSSTSTITSSLRYNTMDAS